MSENLSSDPKETDDSLPVGEAVQSTRDPRESNPTRKRGRCSDETFIRVTIYERDKYPTAQAAADACDLTLNSFTQRLSKSRTKFPAVFTEANCPHYGGGPGNKAATAQEMADLNAKLAAEFAARAAAEQEAADDSDDSDESVENAE